jgi:hypothetical protein
LLRFLLVRPVRPYGEGSQTSSVPGCE